MLFSKNEVIILFREWLLAWNSHNLEEVMKLLHDDIVFENWTGEVIGGKDKLKKSWRFWFLNHGNFKFTEEDIFFDEKEQKMLFRWILTWPSLLKTYRGKPEVRNGCDILYFQDGKIIRKCSFTKTTIQIEGLSVSLE